MWHIPASPYAKPEDASDTSYASTYSAYDNRRSLAIGISVSGDSNVVSCLDQLKRNVHGRTAGLSLSLSLVSLVYLFKWVEIMTDLNSTPGARVIARFQVQGYTATFSILLYSFFMSENNSEYVIWIWMMSNCAFVANMFWT